MAIQVRLLRPTESDVLTQVAPDVFDEPVDPQLTAEFLADPRHHLAVALDSATVVGMASAVDYVHPDKPVELWINEVGVAPAYQRQGIGRRLLQVLFALAAERGWGTAWVATEHDNVAARGLYADAGGEEDAEVVVYTFKIGPHTQA